MADTISAKRRSDNMRRIRSKDMKPEMVVRKLVHGMGCRYRLHRKNLPGKPDLVFASRQKVIFVHGCYWHQHDDPSCKISRLPKSNLEYWLPKLNRNKERDLLHLHELELLGWTVMVIWECETKDVNVLADKIRAFLA